MKTYEIKWSTTDDKEKTESIKTETDMKKMREKLNEIYNLYKGKILSVIQSK